MHNKVTLETLLNQYLEDLYRLAYRLTGHKEMAEDLVQDMFLDIKLSKMPPEDIQYPRAWLASILYRRFVDGWRKEKRSPIRFWGEGEGQSISQLYENSHSEQLSPEESMVQHDFYRVLEQALQHLNEDQRRILILHDVEGYTLLEIAAMTRDPIGTLKSRLHRSRQKLQELLDPVELLTPVQRTYT